MATLASKLRDKDYYLKAKLGSLDLTHPAMVILAKYLKSASRIIDLGCGEGTRLANLEINKKTAVIGVDASSKAITMAQKQYPKLEFKVANLETLPYKDQSFDLAYSAYVFEHLENPEQVLKEAQRILKDGGKLIIIAPNFGAPNRRSPNSAQDKFTKLVKGFMADLLMLATPKRTTLNWQVVKPLKTQYTIDADTVIEPYLNSLIKYCQNLGFSLVETTTSWPRDRFSYFQFIFKFLGSLKIYPFIYWGPHLCLVVEKL